MPDILVRKLGTQTVRRLKEQAKRHGRSLQEEARHILEQAAATSDEEVSALFGRWEKRFAGRKFGSSAALVCMGRSR